MNIPFNDHILADAVPFAGRDGRSYEIRPLDKTNARISQRELCEIHNIIPYVNWDSATLLADESSTTGEPFVGKWQLSLCIMCEAEIVGLLIVYLRGISERHPLRALYIHRLAIKSEHQRNGVGVQFLSFALALYYRRLPTLLTISIQTNDEPSNEHVLDLYRKLRFRDAYPIKYPEKLDVLMELERGEHIPEGWLLPSYADLRVPRADSDGGNYNRYEGGAAERPQVYLATSSKEKLGQYRYLCRCFGIELQRMRHTVSLTEPQPEGAGVVAETALVAGPLKLFSRFAALTNKYPIMVEDTMLFIEHFNRDYDHQPILPGADTKRWWLALRDEGVLRVLENSVCRRAKYVCQIGLNLSAGEYRYFRAEVHGSLATSVRVAREAIRNFPYTNATFFHSIFIPTGADKTIAEMDALEFVKHDYRRKCMQQAVEAIQSVRRGAPQLTFFGSS